MLPDEDPALLPTCLDAWACRAITPQNTKTPHGSRGAPETSGQGTLHRWIAGIQGVRGRTWLRGLMFRAQPFGRNKAQVIAPKAGQEEVQRLLSGPAEKRAEGRESAPQIERRTTPEPEPYQPSSQRSCPCHCSDRRRFPDTPCHRSRPGHCRLRRRPQWPFRLVAAASPC